MQEMWIRFPLHWTVRFEEPEKVKNITVDMHGASSEFVYEAPPYSVSALRLKKCEAF